MEPRSAPAAVHTASLTAGTVRLWGHACIQLRTAGCDLLIDPFEQGALGGALRPATPHGTFTHVFCSHEHADHNAVHVAGPATRITQDCSLPDGSIVSLRTAFHDELGGRLRGGAVQLLRVQTAAGVFVHLSDLGERPGGALEDWLAAVPIDVLILPVGGYYTLDGDGAAMWAEALRPRVVVPCHAREHGAALAPLASEALFVDRFATVTHLTGNTLRPSDWPATNAARPHVVTLQIDPVERERDRGALLREPT